MGRKSREKRERRDANTDDRIKELEEELTRLADGDAEFHWDDKLSAEMRQMNLEDILAFESVGSRPSLFEGLVERGMKLPPPEELDEKQCREKIMEVIQALMQVRVFLVGFEEMTPRELYSTLWHETLWEGCYVEKRISGAVTMIDVSHQWSRSDWKQYMQELRKGSVVH